MKQIKMTYWLLGFGCGIILSGIVGTICTLNVQEYKISVSSTEELEPIETNNQDEEIKPDNEKVEEYKTEKYEDEIQVSNQDSSETDRLEVNAQIPEEIPEEIEIYIPSMSNATEIAGILEDAEIIDDSKAFIDFLKQNKKTTKLKHGKITFPKIVTYEEILSILLNN